MIAIPNINKPQNCQECPAHTFNYGYIPGDNGCRILKRAFNIDKLDINPFNEVLPGCPLIDIVECWECEYYQGHEEYCDNDYFAREHGFCFYGIRRKDGV